MVLRIDQHSVLVSHQSIPGYMDAMVMPFPVHRPRDLVSLKPGAQIDFRLVVQNRRSHIDNIRVRSSSADGVIEDQGDRIELRDPAEKVVLGSPMPDFALTDQDGSAVRLSDFAGKVVAVNFIYTRCPLPDVCPRLSANFARMQSRFSQRLGRDLMLLSITIDPEYDTPAELAKYAKIWKARAEGWRFLTGSNQDVQTAARRFGMNYWAEEGLITHTSRTGVLSRDGRLVAVVEGSSYRANELGDLIEKELEKP